MKIYRYFFVLSLILNIKIISAKDNEQSFSSVLKEVLPQDYRSIEDNNTQESSSVLLDFSKAIPTNQILLKCLNKITAHVQDIKAKIGEKMIFGTLEITARFCQKSAPEDFPDFIAYLEVVENKYGQPLQSIFKGWMFASFPAISAIEHPVYDIWVQSCDNTL